MGMIFFANSQSFYKSGNPIGDGWNSSDASHIANSTASVSASYSESNTSPSATGSNNAVFNNCTPNNTTYNLTSPVISSVGYSNIRVGFGRRISSTFPSVGLEFYDGSNWNTITIDAASGANSTWSTLYFDLPSIANNNSQLRFRFTFQTSTATNCVAPPNFRFDDFWVGANFKLPIQLSSFDISRQNGKPNITWASLSEQNNHYYSLERSSDNKTFTEIKRVSGFGPGTTDKKAEYFHTDQSPVPGINYYRLRQVDLDGTETIYPVKSIFIAPEKTMVFPTMFNSSISILFTDPPSPNDKWQLINTNGQLIKRGQFSDKNVQQEIHFGDLVSGVYSFLINGKEGKQVFKLIKN